MFHTRFLSVLKKTKKKKTNHPDIMISWSVLTLTTKMSSAAAAAAKSRQSCPTLCDPIDGSPSGSPIPGILQSRTLEWVAISFSNAWKWKVKVKSLSCVQLFTTPWTAAYQAPPSMGFSRQEYWMGCHCLLQMYSIFPQTGNIGPWIFLSSSIYYSFNNYPPISL